MAETQVPFLDEPGISDPPPGKLPSHADLIKNIWYQKKGNFRGFQDIFILKIFILLKKKKLHHLVECNYITTFSICQCFTSPNQHFRPQERSLLPCD